LRYARKYFPRAKFRAVCASVLAGSALRAMGKVLSGRSGNVTGAFGPVAQLALSGLLTGQVRTARAESDRASGRERQPSISGPVR
jgi:hypothetical protein